MVQRHDRCCVPHMCKMVFFFDWSALDPYLHSFPTRRSSDLAQFAADPLIRDAGGPVGASIRTADPAAHRSVAHCGGPCQRSEEHTSELQSQSNLVCRLLLEKKKNKSRCRYRHSDAEKPYLTI